MKGLNIEITWARLCRGRVPAGLSQQKLVHLLESQSLASGDWLCRQALSAISYLVSPRQGAQLNQMIRPAPRSHSQSLWLEVVHWINAREECKLVCCSK